MQMEGNGDGVSQQLSCSDSGLLAIGKRIMEEALKNGGQEGKTIIIAIVQQGNGRVEIQSSEENLSAGGTRNDSPKEKVLQLTFIGEVPDTVWTSTVLKSRNGECLKLALVDSETGEIVDRVPESYAEVEIVVLEGKSNVTLENFERRIIKKGEKKKPHFVNRVYIDLVKGVGDLSDVKLGQNSVWTKKCECRLGAKIGQNLYAWTSPFVVIDKREEDNKNKKHYPPLLSSEVWRLDQIGKDGARHKRLKEKNIETVSDFLLWLHADPEGLKKILLGDGRGRGRDDSNWETIVDHVKTCTTDDDQRVFSHKSSIEPQTSDVPYRSSLGIAASTNSSLQPLSEHIYQPTEQRSSSQNIDPYSSCDSGPPHSRVQEEMGELCNPADLDHETPLLSNEVSRLANICKDGEIHKRLHVNGINTVEEFLVRLLRDEEEIRLIVSLEREEWEAMVSNAAQACSTGDRAYSYTSLKLKKGVVFNLLGDVLGLLSFNKHFFPTSTLSEHDKGEARELLASARKNWEDVVPYNEADRLDYQPSFPSGSDVFLRMNEPFDSAVPEYYDDFLRCSPNPMDLYLEDPQHYGAYAEPHVVFSTRDAPKGWKFVKFVVCVPKWWFSITVRVPRPHVTRKRKRGSKCAVV